MLDYKRRISIVVIHSIGRVFHLTSLTASRATYIVLSADMGWFVSRWSLPRESPNRQETHAQDMRKCLLNE